jgi:FAD/FMN-containing dehydrogenase
VIDLAPNMHNVRVDPAAKLAYVEGGCTWGEVDEAAIKHGKIYRVVVDSKLYL